MEEITFDDIIKQTDLDIRYKAQYDPETLSIIKLGPEISITDQEHCIDVEEEIALRILSGEIRVHNCFLDIDSGKVEITESKSLNKIDDVLHRIPLVYWSQHENADIYTVFDATASTVTIMLGHQWGGEYVDDNAVESVKPRKIYWEGDTEMEFLITGFNDPNLLYDKFKFSIRDLSKGSIVKKVTVPHKDVSIYTRRLFKKYVMEIS